MFLIVNGWVLMLRFGDGDDNGEGDDTKQVLVAWPEWGWIVDRNLQLNSSHCDALFWTNSTRGRFSFYLVLHSNDLQRFCIGAILGKTQSVGWLHKCKISQSSQTKYKWRKDNADSPIHFHAIWWRGSKECFRNVSLFPLCCDKPGHQGDHSYSPYNFTCLCKM